MPIYTKVMFSHNHLPMTIHFQPATADDFETLLQLRLITMRPSLEKLGRFDPDRARQRFQAAFQPHHLRHIVVEGVRVGCVALKPGDNHWQVDQFYLYPDWQGKGIGSTVLQQLIAEASDAGKPMKVEVLKGSEANHFYQRHGFVLTHEEEWDNYYERPVTSTLP